MTLRSPVGLNQYRGSRLVTPPANQPITASELQAFLRVDDCTVGFAEAEDLITEARQYLEDQSGMALLTQSWRLTIDHWPREREQWWDGVKQMSISELYGPQSYATLFLPRYPLQSITSVTVYDEDSNAESVVVANTFDIDIYQFPGRLRLKSGATWPVALRDTNAIEVVYVAGYGNNMTDIPAPIRRAVKQLAAHLYTFRGDGCGVDEAYHASGAASIMSAYRPVKL